MVDTKQGKDLELLKRIEEILDEVEEVLEENEEIMADDATQCATCPCGLAPEDCYRWRSGVDVPLTIKEKGYNPWLSR